MDSLPTYYHNCREHIEWVKPAGETLIRGIMEDKGKHETATNSALGVVLNTANHDEANCYCARVGAREIESGPAPQTEIDPCTSEL